MLKVGWMLVVRIGIHWRTFALRFASFFLHIMDSLHTDNSSFWIEGRVCVHFLGCHNHHQRASRPSSASHPSVGRVRAKSDKELSWAEGICSYSNESCLAKRRMHANAKRWFVTCWINNNKILIILYKKWGECGHNYDSQERIKGTGWAWKTHSLVIGINSLLFLTTSFLPSHKRKYSINCRVVSCNYQN